MNVEIIDYGRVYSTMKNSHPQASVDGRTELLDWSEVPDNLVFNKSGLNEISMLEEDLFKI
jgi:hypothetical protein